MALYRGSFQPQGGTFANPDFLYYNASIINNSTSVTDATGSVQRDPAVRFIETRDKEILQNAGEYYFSVIRCQMNGTGRDLPLFIPMIETGGNQSDVNKTVYGMAFSWKQTFSVWNPAASSASDRTVQVCPPVRNVIYESETKNPVLAPTPSSFSLLRGDPQDISTRYYWVYTYNWWLQLVNRTILNPDDLDLGNGGGFTCCWGDTYQALLNAEPLAQILFPTLRAFNDYVNAPQFVYDSINNRFTLYGDSDGFGERINLFIPQNATGITAVINAKSPPTARMFVNSNMFGLFANFTNIYWNTSLLGALSPFGSAGLSPDVANGGAIPPVPLELVNEYLFTNDFYTNIADYRLPPEGGRSPMGLAPVPAQKPYWLIKQDSPSTDSLWSPIEALVITSNMLGVVSEFVSPPVLLGNGNNNGSQPVALSAFDPIIADVAVDSSQLGSSVNRQYILWEPKAEFRLADFSTKGTAVRSIDIQIFWRCRLNGQLYPLNMFNLSSVSIKCMFQHRSLKGGKGNW